MNNEIKVSLFSDLSQVNFVNIDIGNLSGYWDFNDQTDPTDDVSANSNTGDVSGAIFTGT